MMNEPVKANPNDYKVVSFHNSEVFGFTPDMGCMYDGRAVNGKNGSPGIDAGETIILPYHIGHRIATNLAKIAMLRMAPNVDAAGIPTGVPLWDSPKLENMKNSYLKELYSEEKPVIATETDKLMAKVEEYKKMVDTLLQKSDAPKSEEIGMSPVSTGNAPVISFQDKKEVIDELTKRAIKFDARKSKAELEKLLA